VQCQLNIVKQAFNPFNKKAPTGHYAVFCNLLSAYVLYSLYNKTSADAAVDRLGIQNY
jgi:hypothetical protein